MLFCIYWLFGFLNVELIGEAEKLLNVAARHNIRFWNLHFKNGKITGSISVSNFRKLFCVYKGTRAHLKVLKKSGLPIIIHRYRNRLGFFLGLAVYCSILYSLSLFIWTVNVTGNEVVSSKTVIDAAKDIGIFEGVLKRKINPTVDAQRLLLGTDELAWASLNIEGCVLNINVSEVVNKEPEESRPSNLVALADGVIEKIDITSGNAVVKVGDVVTQGDLLVSGIIESMYSTTFVKSSGTVTAETTHIFELEHEFEKTLRQKSGKVNKHSVLSIFGLDIPLFLSEVRGNYETSIKHHQARLFGEKIPISLTVKTYEQLKSEKIKYTSEEAILELEKELECILKEKEMIKYEVVDKNIQSYGNGIKLIATVKCTENIATQKYFLFGIKN